MVRLNPCADNIKYVVSCLSAAFLPPGAPVVRNLFSGLLGVRRTGAFPTLASRS